MMQPLVRRGGIRTADGYRFELTGGHPALDLANTLDERPTPNPRELLSGWDDLMDWCEQSAVIDLAAVRRLRRSGALRPEEAAAVVRRVRFLRESLFRLFAAAAAGRPLPAEHLAILNDALTQALPRLYLAPANGGFRWAWAHPEEALDCMVAPVVHAAAELLLDRERLGRVRICEAADSCRWLFLDLSRNRSRRWCDMTVCGNREKSRRHQARARSRRSVRARRPAVRR